MDKAQEKIESMLNDLNSVNDEFINGYFDEESDNNLEVEKTTENVEYKEECPIQFDMPDKFDNEKIIIEKEENEMTSDELVEETISSTEEDIEEELEKTKSYSRCFSYNAILNKLDAKKDEDIVKEEQDKKIDIDNSNKIFDLIEKSNSSEEFFNAIEQDEFND